MPTNDDAELDHLFQKYREACPDIEPGINFMPGLWQKIEGRQSLWFNFRRLGKTMTTASAALCLLLLLLNLISTTGGLPGAPTYADALMADHSAEQTDYVEAIRNGSNSDRPNAQPAR